LRYYSRMSNYKDIIRNVRQRDRRAQMEFYDMFSQDVFVSAHAVTGNATDAEEIMQDCILKVLTSSNLLRDDPIVMKRLLCRMAINKAIDMLRRKKDIFITVESYENIDYEEEDDDTEKLSTDEIRDAVNHLPDAFRSILALRLFEEMTFDEIACLLNLIPSTARVCYTRGIRKLRTILNQKNKHYA